MTIIEQSASPTATPTRDTGTTNPARRPSPHPRPTTHGDSPISSGESETAPQAPESLETGLESSNLQSRLTTARDWLRRWWAASRAYWVPPSVLTDPPPSLAELASYAWRGGWTTAETGLVRRAGIWWHRLVSLPATTVCRYVEWLFQRPGRLLPVFALWKLLISTGGGPWAADHLIHPVLGLVAWVLL